MFAVGRVVLAGAAAPAHHSHRLRNELSTAGGTPRVLRTDRSVPFSHDNGPTREQPGTRPKGTSSLSPGTETMDALLVTRVRPADGPRPRPPLTRTRAFRFGA